MSEPRNARATAVWQRGPVAGYALEWQPAVHAILDVIEEVALVASDLTHTELWARPGGVASIGFHLVHLPGSTDRLFSYALGEALSDDQRAYLKSESIELDESVSAAELVQRMTDKMQYSLSQLSRIPAGTFYDIRYVGRARLESTVWGLIFHAAEHASRHAGQIVTTAQVVRGRQGA